MSIETQQKVVQHTISLLRSWTKEMSNKPLYHIKESDIFPEGVCKHCRGEREVDVSRHMFRNEGWPEGAYGTSKDGVRGCWVRCHVCNGDGIFADNI